MNEILGAIGFAVVIGFFALIFLVATIKNLIYLCSPNEILLFAGRGRFEGKLKRNTGYRLIRGGRGIRVPLLERVYKMDISNIAIQVEITNAFSKGGIPLNVQGVANLKIASDQPYVGRAAERFLGRDRQEVIKVAKETLEGNLRGVLARLTPEQVNEDKNAFAEQLVGEADDDLKTLGLILDTLKIQNVTDDVGYLDAIGRRRSAELQKTATIAEAKAKAESTIKDASNTEHTAVARIDAQISVAKAEAERRIADAKTKKGAMVAEQRGEVLSDVARAGAEMGVQEARLEQVRRKLQADVIQPAAAKKEQLENVAKARAAKIRADGMATVQALQEYVDAWQNSGGSAREVIMMQKLRTLSEAFASTVHNVNLDNIAVVDSAGSGSLGSDLPKMVVDIASRLKAALGYDPLTSAGAEDPQAGRRPTPPGRAGRTPRPDR